MRLVIDRQSPLPLHEQLTEQIRLLIETAELEPGDSLPTIKDAADRLEVNPNTIAGAYRALEKDGYLTQRKRAGTTVAPSPPRRLERALVGRLAAEAAERARAAGLDPADLVRAIAVHGVIRPEAPRLKVAVLAATGLRAADLARRAGSALGSSVLCVPLTPAEYVSVDYHLTVVDPQLTGRFAEPPAGAASDRPLPAYLAYGPEFPAAAD
ncbi:MAG: GntR family transcriptional regulator [Trueperaceae bacterium]